MRLTVIFKRLTDRGGRDSLTLSNVESVRHVKADVLETKTFGNDPVTQRDVFEFRAEGHCYDPYDGPSPETEKRRLHVDTLQATLAVIRADREERQPVARWDGIKRAESIIEGLIEDVTEKALDERPHYVDEDRKCKKCGETVATLSSDDLCDSCVEQGAQNGPRTIDLTPTPDGYEQIAKRFSCDIIYSKMKRKNQTDGAHVLSGLLETAVYLASLPDGKERIERLQAYIKGE